MHPHTPPTCHPDLRTAIHTAVAPYLDVTALRQIVAAGGNVRQALHDETMVPEPINAALDALTALLHPAPRTRIQMPDDIAGLLLLAMGRLDQEELWVICLDSKNHIEAQVMVYRGSLYTSVIRIAEIFHPAIWRSSAKIIVAHNHPSGDPTPSPEDVQINRQIVDAGRQLDIEVLDHLIMGQGRFVSLRVQGLGFS